MAIRTKDLGEKRHWNWLVKAGLTMRGWVLNHGKIK
jgi:hypothetical protein